MDASTFSNKDLFTLALTHRSYDRSRNNERLEFLGDSVLGMLVTEWLLSKGNHTEGQLSKIKAQLVSTSHLAEVAVTLGLPDRLILGKSQSHERNNPRILASAVEAVIGAIYTYSGIDKARVFVTRRICTMQVARDYKTELQERLQPRPIRYAVVRRSGPPHAPTYTSMVSLENGSPCFGTGPSVKAAEQDAAHAMLLRMEY
jgi:ribonuclease-3